jgi:hypothetical protein
MAKSDKPFYTSTSNSTGSPAITSTSSSTAAASGVAITTQVYEFESKRMSDIEKAVYAHIQAVRTLGRNQINTVEIAQALDIPAAYVLAAIEKLRTKGVRIAE